MAKKHKVLLTGVILAVVICIVGEFGIRGINTLREAYAQRRKVEQFYEDLINTDEEDSVNLEDIPIEECVNVLTNDQYDENVKEYLIHQMNYTYTGKELADVMTGLLADDTTDLTLKWQIVETFYIDEEYMDDPEQYYASIGKLFLSADTYQRAYNCASELCYAWDEDSINDRYWGSRKEANHWVKEYLEPVLKAPDSYPDHIVLGIADAVYDAFDADSDMKKIALDFMKEILVSCPMTPENQQMLVVCYRAADTPEELRIMLEHLNVIWQDKALYDRDLLEDHIYAIEWKENILIKWLLNDPATEDINDIITYCNIWADINGNNYWYIDEQILALLNKVIDERPGEQLNKLEIYEIRYIDDKTILTMDLDDDGLKDTVTIHSYTSGQETVLEIAFGNGDSLTCPALDPSGTSWTGDFKLYMQDVNADGSEELVLLGLYTISESEESEDAAYNPEERREIGVSVFRRDEVLGEYQMLMVEDLWELYFPAEDADFVDEEDIPYYMLQERELWQ